MTTKRINPAVLHPLKEALTYAYWYKTDLRPFLASCLSDKVLVAQLDWVGSYKRVIVAQLVDALAADQHRHFEDLLNLLLSTADIPDPIHLKRLDDGESKYRNAVNAIGTLKAAVEPLRALRTEQDEANRRRESDRIRAEALRAMREKISELKQQFYEIVALPPQQRGYALEKFLNELFALFDIDAKAPFAIRGEQIDGAFTFDGEYLLEAKWHDAKTPPAHVDTFARKVGRKLDNTLGLFVSMNGYQDSVFDLMKQGGRPSVILVDGADLHAVIDERIDLPDLLRRKRQHAARTGEVFVGVYQLLS
jgi:hypothetical protein